MPENQNINKMKFTKSQIEYLAAMIDWDNHPLPVKPNTFMRNYERHDKARDQLLEQGIIRANEQRIVELTEKGKRLLPDPFPWPEKQTA